MKRRLPWLLLALGVLVAPVNAQASLVRAMSLAELTAAARQIVVADVASVDCRWDKAHRNIHSIVELRVQESWKGEVPADGRMVLRQPGGTVGQIEMTVVGMATFSAGERVLLFLDRDSVVGLGQGKRQLRWDQTSKRWLAGLPDGSSAVHIDRRGQIRAPQPGSPEPQTLDGLRERVHVLLERRR